MRKKNPSIHVSVSVLNQMLQYLKSLDIDYKEVLLEAGIEEDITLNPDVRIPIEQYLSIEDAAAYKAEDPYFGLHMGEFFEPGNWSILGYLMMNCKTLGEAFEKSSRYQAIIGNLIQGRIKVGFNKVTVILTIPPYAPPLSRHCFESALSSTVRMMRTLTGKDLDPLEVTFNYPAPESDSEYRRIFRCPVLFDHKHTSITFDTSIASIPTTIPNPGLLEYFEQYARDYLAQLEKIDQTTREVTRLILARMDTQKLTLQHIASDMAMSPRTLQNHLKKEGVNFRALVEDTRKRLAKQYLRQNYTVEDITYMLGFAEPSVFRRAFKKWSGTTPGEYRQSTSSLDTNKLYGTMQPS